MFVTLMLDGVALLQAHGCSLGVLLYPALFPDVQVAVVARSAYYHLDPFLGGKGQATVTHVLVGDFMITQWVP